MPVRINGEIIYPQDFMDLIKTDEGFKRTMQYFEDQKVNYKPEKGGKK